MLGPRHPGRRESPLIEVCAKPSQEARLGASGRGEQRSILRVTAVNPRDHLIYSLAVGTGLRLAEIVGLNVGDAFFPDGRPRTRVRIRAEIAKGGRQGDVFLPDALVAGLGRRSGARGYGPTTPSRARRITPGVTSPSASPLRTVTGATEGSELSPPTAPDPAASKRMCPRISLDDRYLPAILGPRTHSGTRGGSSTEQGISVRVLGRHTSVDGICSDLSFSLHKDRGPGMRWCPRRQGQDLEADPDPLQP